MSPLTLLLGTLAGICIATGIIFLFTGLRRPGRDRVHILFALFAFSYAGANLTSIMEYKTTTLEAFMLMGDWTAIFIVATLVFLLWFVSAYTQVKPKIFLWGLTFLFGAITFVAVSSPTSVHGEIIGIVNATLPWGETITLLDASEGQWELVFFFSQLSVIGFLIFACIKQWRQGERRKASMLALGLFFLIFGLVFDMFLIDTGVINFVYIGDYAFIPLLVIMSLQLSNQVIQTDEELATYQHNLERMVAERTDKLEKTASALRKSERQTRALLDAPPDTAMLVTAAGDILETNLIAASHLGLTVEDAIGKNVFDFFEPEVAAVRKSKKEELVEKKQPMQWEDQRGDRFYHNQMYPVLDENHVIESVAVYATDISARKRAEDNLENSIEELRLLNRIASAIASQTEISAVLESVSELTTSLFQAVSTYIFFVPEEDQNLEIYSGYDRRTGFQKARSIPLHLDQVFYAKAVMEKNQATILSDLDSLSINDDIKKNVLESQIQQIMIAPLSIKGESIGIIAVNSGDDRPANDQHELEVLEAIAGYIAISIENHRLIQENIEAAAVEERSRLAHDLHDAVTQTIYSASLIAEVLPQVWDRNPEEGQRNLTKLRALVRGALAEMRTMLFELRPAALEVANLETLMDQLGDTLHGRTRIPVRVECDDIPELPSQVKIMLYRIAQEAVNNIIKHAAATQTKIELHKQADQVFLRIWDNGRGFELQEGNKGGLGLDIMRERAKKINAQLQVESEPGKGTQVTAFWQIPGQNNNEV